MMKTARHMLAGLVATMLAGPVLGQGDPAVGTDLDMRAVTVKDQNQLRGHFGAKWQADEVRDKAAQVCAEAGFQLIYFQPGNKDSNGRTEFAAVCK